MIASPCFVPNERWEASAGSPAASADRFVSPEVRDHDGFAPPAVRQRRGLVDPAVHHHHGLMQLCAPVWPSNSGNVQPRFGDYILRTIHAGHLDDPGRAPLPFDFHRQGPPPPISPMGPAGWNPLVANGGAPPGVDMMPRPAPTSRVSFQDSSRVRQSGIMSHQSFVETSEGLGRTSFGKVLLTHFLGLAF